MNMYHAYIALELLLGSPQYDYKIDICTLCRMMITTGHDRTSRLQSIIYI
jgi:hypothetical protein